MILVDTHIFVWFIDGSKSLSKKYIEFLNKEKSIGLSIISLWEIAKLNENNKLTFECTIDEWFDKALNDYNIKILELNPKIILESTRLPGNFHKDPADQLIVATSRILKIPLMTMDKKY